MNMTRRRGPVDECPCPYCNYSIGIPTSVKTNDLIVCLKCKNLVIVHSFTKTIDITLSTTNKLIRGIEGWAADEDDGCFDAYADAKQLMGDLIFGEGDGNMDR